MCIRDSIEGRLIEEKLPWDYRARLKEFLKPYTRLLDMGTGGGEFLLSLKHPFHLTSVTEGFEPNYELCVKKLSPLGITVKKSVDGEPLPFGDESFDLVINRHEFYDISEVRRVLKKGGHFITQQAGGENGKSLAQRVLPGYIRAVSYTHLPQGSRICPCPFGCFITSPYTATGLTLREEAMNPPSAALSS